MTWEISQFNERHARMTFIDYFTYIAIATLYLLTLTQWLHQNMHQVHVSLNVIIQNIKQKEQYGIMGIIGSYWYRYENK